MNSETLAFIAIILGGSAGLVSGVIAHYFSIKGAKAPDERRLLIRNVIAFWTVMILFMLLPMVLFMMEVIRLEFWLISLILFGVLVIPGGFFGQRRHAQMREKLHVFQQAAVEELREARRMQMSLLPKSSPQIEGFDIEGTCEPATDVGGDFFTYLWLDEAETQLGIVLMDVVDHGMKAATTTFLANGMLRAEVRNTGTPTEILTQMNQHLREILPSRTFVATAFAQIDLTDNTLTDFNAGLPEPVLLRDNKPVELSLQSTVPLGCGLSAEYVGKTIPLCSGDVLLFFSDGLAEARDAHEQTYEDSRLMTLLTSLANQPKSAQGLMEAILRDVRDFTVSDEQEDDLTLVVMRVL